MIAFVSDLKGRKRRLGAPDGVERSLDQDLQKTSHSIMAQLFTLTVIGWCLFQHRLEHPQSDSLGTKTLTGMQSDLKNRMHIHTVCEA